MLHFVNFKMPLTCFMSPEGKKAAGWDDGKQTGVLCPNMGLWGSGISKCTCDMKSC